MKPKTRTVAVKKTRTVAVLAATLRIVERMVIPSPGEPSLRLDLTSLAGRKHWSERNADASTLRSPDGGLSRSQAEAEFRKVLIRQLRVQAPDHPHTLDAGKEIAAAPP
jgi:hypothetical protein